jgi:hypothetical protein
MFVKHILILFTSFGSCLAAASRSTAAVVGRRIATAPTAAGVVRTACRFAAVLAINPHRGDVLA